MCEERERLIGYVYDECDATERRVVEQHLETCPTCRTEIRGLRSVRQDLLAWEVPEHTPIWRPLAPARVESPWQAMPAWAMAAAAALLLMVGGAGGAATYALFPRAAVPAANAQVTTPSAPVATGNPSQAALLATFEERLRKLEQGNTAGDARMVSMPSMASSPEFVRVNAATRALTTRIDDLASRQNEFSRTLYALSQEASGLRVGLRGLQSSNLSTVSFNENAGGGR